MQLLTSNCLSSSLKTSVDPPSLVKAEPFRENQQVSLSIYSSSVTLQSNKYRRCSRSDRSSTLISGNNTNVFTNVSVGGIFRQDSHSLQNTSFSLRLGEAGWRNGFKGWSSPTKLHHFPWKDLQKRKRRFRVQASQILVDSGDSDAIFNKDSESQPENKDENKTSGLLTCISLVVGTAVGPGVLGLPAFTLPSGLLPSTLIILASWSYVMASILLVVEVSHAAMAANGLQEVSFTGLAAETLGPMGALIAATVYGALNYALLVACIAGLGEILSVATSSFLSPPMASLACTGIIAWAVTMGSFSLVDNMNRILCGLMLASSALLLALGLPHIAFQKALSTSVWKPSAMLPAVPITVLTLGFHVVTPLICSLLRSDVRQSRKAVLLGGTVPLAMVLAWNTVIIGITPPISSPSSSSSSSTNPILLLLSLGTSAAPCVRAFAFSALGTTLIGYALSFPKQLSDTIDMWKATLTPNSDSGKSIASENILVGERTEDGLDKRAAKNAWVFAFAIVPPLVLAISCPAIFSSALDYAGLYFNCFLFGILPPVMAWVLRYGSPFREKEVVKHPIMLPGGRLILGLLMGIALFLGLRPPF